MRLLKINYYFKIRFLLQHINKKETTYMIFKCENSNTILFR